MNRWIALLACPLLLTACATYKDLESTETTAQQNYELAREDYQRLKGQVEGLQIEIDRMRAELDRLRSGPSAQVQSVQATVDQLAQRLQAEESARQRDKQEIVDTLSGKITKIMATSAASKPRPAPRKFSGEGYEHVVEAGQTISAIAAAYNVKAGDIMDANGITDATKIRVGQKLVIPAP
jgi:LysM repeat protein